LALKNKVPSKGKEVPPFPITTFEAEPTDITIPVTKICDPATAALIVPKVFVPVETTVANSSA
jgi:hypothetical protein